MQDSTDEPVVFNASWDEEAKVWFVASSTYPGLNAEAKTLDRLMKLVRAALDDLREANGETAGGRVEMRAAA